jgi:cellulose synthase/poly-beta-1,6-N-acetylglucosamine synthase-like glycosyltransferase
MLNLTLDIAALLYSLATLWLATYGLNGLALGLLYWYHRRRSPPVPTHSPEHMPIVTVQLPLFNEKHVAERLIDAVAELDYPRDRLQVQVLDDSTDETTRLVEARAAFHRERGLDIEVLHRTQQDGFKAGALAQAMKHVRGEFIAIFDADFRPYPGFLRESLPYLLSDERLGMVQTRWSHLNARYSPITRVQALALDGHFVVEQTARSRSGLPMHFNGTGGVWRRTCLEESGGWQTDTLCEDLDLSYRAQVRGWRFLYLPDVDVPSELPPQILAFKRQQARWAQGSVQCLRKLSVPILRSAHLSRLQKLMAMVHLSGYLTYPLMVLMLLLAPLAAHSALNGSRRLQFLAPACLGPLLVYVTSQWAVYRDWKRRLLSFPLMVLVGTGIAWSNVLGIWRGLRRWGGVMLRTPKFCLEGQKGMWTDSLYRLSRGDAVVGEVALALYAGVGAALAWRTGADDVLPFLLLYAAAFGLVAVLSIVETWRGFRSETAGENDLDTRERP